ncbi:MAG: amino acid permease, partial [Polyangiaceae bacterium]
VALAATFELWVTALAVFELAVFFGITGPHVKRELLFAEPLLPFGFSGVFAAIPFAIWFYLALEGVAMSAEEVVDPKRDIPKGFLAGIATLVVLATGTLVCTSGVRPWPELVVDDSPLPKAMAAVLSEGHWLTHMMVYIGLFGLLASFHGIMMGYSRQVFALARAGYLPKAFAWVHPERRTPVVAIVVPAIFGMGVVLTKKTDAAITLSVLGATVLYVVSMIALFVLRSKEPRMERPFRAPFYPLFPGLALVLAGVCLVAVVASARALAGVALAAFAAGALYYRFWARSRVLATVDGLASSAGVPASTEEGS